ncbi:hypothetical protein L210DRAFT_3641114 [Boletus edulis BED1]|uniref:Ribonuclease H1 N-terminal domain-containing protein n=1 Tax=Boletus edulis BED1 TaxID=1328754 RepID=A0AAD4GK31_BOLED|nr:hypothetical protein L210DRAFT_3641114 [Boletus edulis BED1]
MHKPTPHFPAKTHANAELDAVMEKLASLDMTAETAGRLIDFITTTSERGSTLETEGIASILSSPQSIFDLEPCTPSPSPTFSAAALVPLAQCSPSDDLTSQSVTSTLVSSIMTAEPAEVSPVKSAGQVAISSTVATPLNYSETSAADAPSVAVSAAGASPAALITTVGVQVPPTTTMDTELPFNPMGPVHLLGAPGMHLESHSGFVYEVPEPHATGPFYLVTRGHRVGVFSGWQTTSPYVIGVSRASFSRVASAKAGLAQLISCINRDLARWLA